MYHKDVKPENIMIDAQLHLKLVDLGLSKCEDMQTVLKTNPGQVLATDYYIAPEQLIKKQSGHAAVDI